MAGRYHKSRLILIQVSRTRHRLPGLLNRVALLKLVALASLAAALLVGLLLASEEVPGHRREARASLTGRRRDGTPKAIHKIRHVVIIMQENRSFDSYFGTYPGADGIPGLAGNPGKLPCVPDPQRHHCLGPYHDVSSRNTGGPHGHGNAVEDIAGGSMDGFIAQAQRGKAQACREVDSPFCSRHPRRPDVMGYHDWREIPNYWDYASHFVLQDHMFESDSSWSLRQQRDVLRSGAARLIDARHLESAAVLRHGARGPPTPQRHAAARLLHRPRE
jgi:phospholipase C